MTDPTTEPSIPTITRASFANSTVRGLAESMVQQNDPLSVQRRWGIIAAINTGDTVNVTIGGDVVEGIAYDANYSPTVGETVYMDIVGADVVVMGTISPSLLNPTQRRATVTSISGDRETVSVTVDDGTLLTNVPVLASYNPVLNDQVHMQSYQGAYLVIGSLDRTAQTYRRAVGDIEPSLTVKPGTLALNGQLVSRTTYANLWAWAQANNLVTPGVFTAGDGSTTFGLPNYAGKTLVGTGSHAGLLWSLGNGAGAYSVTLTTNQMPAHNHSVGVTVAGHTHGFSATSSSDGGHSHGGSTSSGGSHNHSATLGRQQQGVDDGNYSSDVSAGDAGSVTYLTFNTSSNGSHSHSFTTDTESSHSHTVSGTTGSTAPTATVTQTTVGGTDTVDVRQPSAAVHYIIWT